MSERTKGYAEAIVALATAEGALDAVEDELLSVARAIDANPALRERLTDIHAPVAQRLSFVESEVLQAAHPATKGSLALVIAGDRAGDLVAIAREVASQAAAARNRELAEVYVAVPLDDAKREELREALQQATGKQLELKVFVDESVIGGVRAEIGDTVIDGSLAARLGDVESRVGR